MGLVYVGGNVVVLVVWVLLFMCCCGFGFVLVGMVVVGLFVVFGGYLL